MANSYDLGDVVRVTGTWTDPLNSDAAIDPSVVKCSVRTPAGVVTTYTYLTDAVLVKSSTGVYYINIEISEAGLWHYRFFSTGTGRAAEENAFSVVDAIAV